VREYAECQHLHANPASLGDNCDSLGAESNTRICNYLTGQILRLAVHPEKQLPGENARQLPTNVGRQVIKLTHSLAHYQYLIPKY
jgi:hypothetical protein